MKTFTASYLGRCRGTALLAAAVLTLWSAPLLHGATSVTQNGITWTFAEDREVGTFCNGEYWVKGPVTIVGISNNLHAAGFTPKLGQDGSMVNPGATSKQGYDCTLNTYDASLNAGLPNGKPISKDNPLVLAPSQTLISMVSWLYRSEKDTEPGCPRFNGGTKAPRPVTRSAALLTCLTEAPPEGSFRPPYCGSDKTIKYNRKTLKTKLLKNLAPVGATPDVAGVEKSMARTWVDHVHEFSGAMVHPSEHMPNYGRDMTREMSEAALMLQLDFSALPGKPSKDQILIHLVQYGIDSAGIADNGGGWPANGGHGLGRKWPILFAGLMLDDAHMKDVGHWKTRFQEDEQTFYVSQKDVDMTHSSQWAPDKRAPIQAYETEDIGMPEWGIRHAEKPEADNRNLKAMYRGVNTPLYPGMALVVLIMDQKKAWNHDALFDYTDRYMKLLSENKAKDIGKPRPFFANMWKAYRKQCEPPAEEKPPVATPPSNTLNP